MMILQGYLEADCPRKEKYGPKSLDALLGLRHSSPNGTHKKAKTHIRLAREPVRSNKPWIEDPLALSRNLQRIGVIKYMVVEGQHFSIDLGRLQSSCDCLTEHAAGSILESYAVLMDESSHAPGVIFQLECDGEAGSFDTAWSVQIDETMRRAYPDTTARTEQAALAIALALLPVLTPYRARAKSVIGTRFDYHLIKKDAPIDDFYFLNDTEDMGIEVTGIKRDPSPSGIKRRHKKKVDNLDEPGGPGASSGKTYICVVEFSRPAASLVLS